MPRQDQENTGALKIQRFVVGGGLDTNTAEASVRPYKFRILKNALIDKRLGAALKRPGSLTETIDTGLGGPLGSGEYKYASSSNIPTNTAILTNFAGSVFKQKVGSTYSTVTQTSYVNFATTGYSTFSRLGSKLFIAAGRPAKWGGPSTSIDRVGIVPPTTAPSIASTASGTGITLSTGTSYVITLFDSTTGLESDWSPPSDATGAVDNKSITINIPVIVQQNWDKIRVYRYLDGGAFPYLVATVTAGTTSYIDTTPDSQLTERIADRYDNAIPPTASFITAAFANCIWYVDANNPHKLVFSKPYTGADTDLEYFPTDNYVISNEPITGLFVVPGKMLVFHTRKISYISGSSVDDFVFQPYFNGIGTFFHNSIASNGKELIFLGEEGLMAMSLGGGPPRHISREIDEDLQPLLSGSYNNGIQVGTCWNPALRQFIFMIAVNSTANAPWEEVGTGSTATAVAGWETTLLVTDVWEDVDNPNTSASLKIKFWGWSPELSSEGENQFMEYTFPGLLSDNVAVAFPIFLFHPESGADLGNPQQDRTYIGFWDGTQGKVLGAFRRDKTTDDGAVITSEVMTANLAPGNEEGGYKLFHSVGFDGTYNDPSSDSLATIKYLIDFDDPQARNYTSSLITLSGSVDFKKCTTMLGKSIHLYVTDTSASLSKILLSEFFIKYRERLRKESR